MRFHTPSHPRACMQGLSLAECLCSLALLAMLATWSLPGLHTWVLRTRIDATRETWLSDLQAARAQALQSGVEVTLTRRTDCAWLGDSRDWSCGWQVSRSDTQALSFSTALRGDVQVQFSSSERLRINPRGEPQSAGASMKFRAPQAPDTRLSSTVCLNIAGRLHVQAGEACS